MRECCFGQDAAPRAWQQTPHHPAVLDAAVRRACVGRAEFGLSRYPNFGRYCTAGQPRFTGKKRGNKNLRRMLAAYPPLPNLRWTITERKSAIGLMKLVIVFAACCSACAGLSTGSLRAQTVRPHLVPARATFCCASVQPEPRFRAYALQLIGSDDDLASVPTPPPPHPVHPHPLASQPSLPFTPTPRSTLPLPAATYCRRAEGSCWGG